MGVVAGTLRSCTSTSTKAATSPFRRTISTPTSRLASSVRYSFLDKIEHYVTNQQREFGVAELHAAELPDEKLVDICRFLAGGPLSLVGQVTDTEAMTSEQINAHRKAQAAQLEGNLEQYKQGRPPFFRARARARAREAGLSMGVCDGTPPPTKLLGRGASSGAGSPTRL